MLPLFAWVPPKLQTRSIAGKVTSHKGHIQIQIGSSWGKVERINGEEVRCGILLNEQLRLSRYAGRTTDLASSSGYSEVDTQPSHRSVSPGATVWSATAARARSRLRSLCVKGAGSGCLRARPLCGDRSFCRLQVGMALMVNPTVYLTLR